MFKDIDIVICDFLTASGVEGIYIVSYFHYIYFLLLKAAKKLGLICIVNEPGSIDYLQQMNFMNCY